MIQTEQWKSSPWETWGYMSGLGEGEGEGEGGGVFSERSASLQWWCLTCQHWRLKLLSRKMRCPADCGAQGLKARAGQAGQVILLEGLRHLKEGAGLKGLATDEGNHWQSLEYHLWSCCSSQYLDTFYAMSGGALQSVKSLHLV